MACQPFIHKDPAVRGVMETRRFGNGFWLQCGECHEKIGPQIDVANLDVHPSEIERAELKRPKASRTGLGGRGNSRRRNYEARFKEKDWPAKRDACLVAANWECQALASPDCMGVANQADHLTYERFEARRERPEDLQAVCGPCNLELRSRRIMA